MGNKVGIVYLVGAGPGDPGLLTLKGAELLSKAEVVVYDYLAYPGLLELAPSDSEFIYVGKSASNHALSQDGINELLVKKGKEGKIVVRLKGGDPYIFGRGGEEALRLYEENVPFEEVPGISSTIAAAAYAGIPLTHREFSSQVVLLTGHEKPGKEESSHDWNALCKIGTLVAVMGRAQLPHIRDCLIKSGKDPNTPSAMVEWGTTNRQRTVTGALQDLPTLVEEAGLGAPALLIVGKVVSLRDKLTWFDKKPLFGKKILVTRTREQVGVLSHALREKGAIVLERPVIKIEEIDPNPLLTQAISNIKDYKLLILTSPNGASIFLKRLFNEGLDSRALSNLKIAVMGPGTSLPLKEHGLIPDIVPKKFVAESLLDALINEEPSNVLLPRAQETRDILSKTLIERGFTLSEIPIYKTLTGLSVPSQVDIDLDNPPDLTTLTSASCASGLAALIPKEKRSIIKTVSIGPITTKAAKDYGFPGIGEAKVSLIKGLVSVIEEILGKKC
jgi:uroporphyrinogen III methyltransferase/synthase